MELRNAIAVLEALRDGFVPGREERLPASSPCQHPDVVRALYTVLSAAERAPPQEVPAGAAEVAPRARRPRPERAGQRWTPEDDERLTQAFDGGASEAELCGLFGRSRLAVRARLVKLGRLEEAGPLPSLRAVAT